MPALDLQGTDPCSLLNDTDFPKLWPTEPGNINSFYDDVFKTPGSLKPYIDYLNEMSRTGGLEKDILKTKAPNSQFTLIQFLSNGSLAQQRIQNPNSMEGIDYSKLSEVILKTEANIFTIVDSYIMGQKGINLGASYTYSTENAPKLPENKIWNATDSTSNDDIVQSPTSVLGCLLRDGYLIKARELFIPEEFNPGASYLPNPGDESLIYLYRLAQKGTSYLTPEQQFRKSFLETKNLRFFGAFLAEYCFYRRRYEILLKEYFTVYSKPTTGNGMYTSPAQTTKLFRSGTPAPITQQEHLRQLAEQLAILNTRLIDLRKLLGKISLYYNSVYLKIQQTINSAEAMGSNMDLANRITALNESAKEAQKYLSELDFHQGVMEYNSEKNRYGNIMLGLYAFLNIAAVAAILQINQS